jgi:phosphohistidine swiveling domain-containing protein
MSAFKNYFQFCFYSLKLFNKKSYGKNMSREDDAYQLQGLGASPGKVIGKVRLVFKLEDLEKVQKNDIIVAPMINPDMVVALGKASGIVTDAGGLTCHAAIIARELKIPAVVGTGIATKLLQNGMIVEIDGVKGELKILSREDAEAIMNLEQVTETYTIFGNRCPILPIKVPRKEPFFERVVDIPWKDPPEEIRVIAPRPEIVVTPLTYSLVIPALERLPYALGFPDIGPLYTYVINQLVHIDYEKISELMKRSRLILFNRRSWQLYLKNLYEKYELFTNATKEFSKIIKDKSFEDILEKNFIEFWKIHNQFFSQTFLIQAWADDIIWPLIKSILEKYYPKEKSLELLSQLSKLSEPIPSVEFYSDFQALVSTIQLETLKRLLSDKEEEKLLGLEEIKKNSKFEEFINKWYWVRDRDFYHGDLRDPNVFSRFIKLLCESKPIQDEFSLPSGAVAKKMEELGEDFKYFVEVGKILKKERDYHHFLWLKNTSVIKDFFLEYGSFLEKRNILEEAKDVFFFWIPEIYNIIEGKLEEEEIKSIIKTRKKAYLGGI